MKSVIIITLILICSVLTISRDQLTIEQRLQINSLQGLHTSSVFENVFNILDWKSDGIIWPLIKDEDICYKILKNLGKANLTKFIMVSEGVIENRKGHIASFWYLSYDEISASQKMVTIVSDIINSI